MSVFSLISLSTFGHGITECNSRCSLSKLFDHGFTECSSRCSLSDLTMALQNAVQGVHCQNLIMALQNAVQGVHKSGILHEKIMEHLGKLFW